MKTVNKKRKGYRSRYPYLVAAKTQRTKFRSYKRKSNFLEHRCMRLRVDLLSTPGTDDSVFYTDMMTDIESWTTARWGWNRQKRLLYFENECDLLIARLKYR